MARCKDCIHYEACLTFSKFINSARDVEKGCECFKDRTGVVEVVHGRWNESDWSGIKVGGFMACSNCNVMIPTPDGNRYCLHRLHYCPNCGAKMDGEEKDSNLLFADMEEIIDA